MREEMQKKKESELEKSNCNDETDKNDDHSNDVSVDKSGMV